MAPPLTCTTAWMNLETGNIQLKMNRLIKQEDHSKLRTTLTRLLKTRGINFRTYTKDDRLLMEPTFCFYGQGTEEISPWIRDILEEVGFGKNVEIKYKFVSADLFGAGLKSKVTILPSNYFSPQ